MTASGSLKKPDTSNERESGSNRALSGKASLRPGWLYLKPALDPKRPGKVLVVRDPKTKGILPADGGEVRSSQYWMRRLRDRDVLEVKG